MNGLNIITVLDTKLSKYVSYLTLLYFTLTVLEIISPG